MNERHTVRFTAIAAALFLPLSVAAASGAHHEPSIHDIKLFWVNFLIYVVGVFFLARGPIRRGWAARRTKIKESVDYATTQVEVAERELNAVEALTRGLAAEQDRVKEEIVVQSKAEAETIIAQAHERAKRIREQAKEMLAGEGRFAESNFKTSLVGRAVELARSKFAGGEFAGRQQAYVDAAVDRAKRLVH
jgi:F0F1-type ATP synthase membrane subunit b/b'